MTDLKEGLKQLNNLTTKDQRLCLETLIMILRNVDANPQEPKYRTLKLSNKRFTDEVWRHEAARLIMRSAGWIEIDDTVVLSGGVSIERTLKVLVGNRNVKPAECEWVAETKTVGLNEERLREEELKRKALQENQKQLAKMKRDMAERKAIAERILCEHRNDHEERAVTKPSIARSPGSGGSAKMSDFKKQGG